MTGYQFLPPLTDAEYEALRGDIAANGMRHPIVVDEKGKILDGHHRARIAAELGFKPEREVAEGLTDQEKRDLAFTLNAARRHMDGAQRRAAVIASLKADPQLSDRQHARRTGVTHPTVAGIRAELVAKGDVESLSTRTDTAGRQQPAHRDRSPGEAAPALVRPATGSEEPTPGSAAAGGAAASESPGGIDAPPGAGANVPEPPARRDPEPTSGGPAIATTGGPDPDPVADLIANDPDVQAADYMARFSTALARAGGWMQFDAERVAASASPTTWAAIEAHAEVVAHTYERMRKARHTLRVVPGGAA